MISRSQRIWLAALVIGDVLLGVASTWALPARVPVHWNFRGEIDRYGSPWELTLILPICIAACAGLLIALPAIGRFGPALERSRATYGRIAIAIVAALVGIHAILLLRGLGEPIDVVFGLLLIFGVLLLVLGNWMSKLRRNAIVGIRTPWTLKSAVVWERTRRIGGRLQVVHGLLVLLAAFLFPVWIAMLVLVGGLLALVVWALVYSWRVDRGARRREDYA